MIRRPAIIIFANAPPGPQEDVARPEERQGDEPAHEGGLGRRCGNVSARLVLEHRKRCHGLVSNTDSDDDTCSAAV